MENLVKCCIIQSLYKITLIRQSNCTSVFFESYNLCYSVIKISAFCKMMTFSPLENTFQGNESRDGYVSFHFFGIPSELYNGFSFLVMCPDFFGRKCHFQAPEMIRNGKSSPKLGQLELKRNSQLTHLIMTNRGFTCALVVSPKRIAQRVVESPEGRIGGHQLKACTLRSRHSLS